MSAIRKIRFGLNIVIFAVLSKNVYSVDDGCDCRFVGFSVNQYEHLGGQWGKNIDINGYEVPEYLNWNSINRSNFLVAKVVGPRGAYIKTVSVSVVVYKDGLELLHQDFASIYFNKDGFYYVPVLIQGAFCDPVYVKYTLHSNIKLLDQKNVKINYACGE